tara:strand:+ start:5463 stop:5819 length:357 start_codon:yes stop_codon:yes gene_type:complete
MKSLFKFIKACLFLLFSIVLTLALKSNYVRAENNYESHIKSWQENNSLASQYLRKAEEYLKEGDKNKACKMQLKASLYAIRGSESLIKVFTQSGKDHELQDIKQGLSKWKELADSCKP